MSSPTDLRDIGQEHHDQAGRVRCCSLPRRLYYRLILIIEFLTQQWSNLLYRNDVGKRPRALFSAKTGKKRGKRPLLKQKRRKSPGHTVNAPL